MNLDERDEILHELAFRPVPEGDRAVPFGVRSCGRYIVGGSWVEAFPGRHFGELYYGIRGGGRFRCGDARYDLEPGTVLIVPPGIDQRIEPRTNNWEYRWFTVDGPRAADVFGWFGLSLGPHAVKQSVRDEIVSRFDDIRRSIGDASLDGQRSCAAAAYRILSAVQPAEAERRAVDPLIRRALTEIHRRFGDLEFGVEELASALGVHRSRLSRSFRAVQGVSPSAFIRELRVSAARSLLLETTLSIEEIACRCGYADANYFSREIKRRYSLPPTSLRRRGFPDNGGG